MEEKKTKAQILYQKIKENHEDIVFYEGSFYMRPENRYTWQTTTLLDYISKKYDQQLSYNNLSWLSQRLQCKIDSPVLEKFSTRFPIRTANGYDIFTSETSGVVVVESIGGFTPYNIPVDYDPSATGENIDKFMASVVSENSSVENLYEILGEPLIRNGKKSEKAHLIYGPQGCGKSTFVELFYPLYGECATNVPFRNIQTGKRCHALTHSLVNIDDDIDEKQYGDVKMIKQIVSRNAFSVDNLYSNTALEIHPAFCNVFTCNELPEFSSKGEEMSIRFRVEQFTKTFRGTNKCDKDLPKKLQKELPYLLNKCIEGANRLLARNMRFVETADSNAFAEEVERQDTVRSFLEDYENVIESNTLPQVFELYVDAAKRDGKFPLSKHRFGKRLRALGWSQTTSRDSYGNVYYHWKKPE